MKNKLGMRCAKLISSFGLAWQSLALPGWIALVWRGLVWFGIHVKLNYQVSLLYLDGWGKSIQAQLGLSLAIKMVN